jgi:hypothetical protein
MYALVYAVSSVAAGGRGGSSAGTKVIHIMLRLEAMALW